MRWVLLPGFDGTGILFEPFLRSLPAGVVAQVVIYPTDRVCSADEFAQIALAVLPKSEPYVLIAESCSGPIALKISIMHPLPPVAIVLCASFATCPVSRGLIAMLDFCGGLLCRFRLPRWAVKRYLLAGASDEVLSLFYTAINSMPPRVLASRFGVLRAFDASFAPRSINQPMLYLQATRDRIVAAQNGHLIQQRYPHVRMERIDSPHLILQSQPQAAARAVSAFVAWASPPAVSRGVPPPVSDFEME